MPFDILTPAPEDVQKMLSCQVHIGTRNLDPNMEQYIWKRRADGVYLLDLKKTWEKIVFAARVLVAIENPSDIVLVSTRPTGQRAIMKFGSYTGCTPLVGRFCPGTFTNQIQKTFVEPRLLLVQDPRTDHQPLRESSYVNVPTMAFCHTDAPLRYVDIAIPCNNKSRNAVGLMYWLLARELLCLRGSVTCSRNKPWDVMVDIFFYRDPEDEENTEKNGEKAPEDAAATEGESFGQGEYWNGAAAATGQWDASVVGTGDWGSGAQE